MNQTIQQTAGLREITRVLGERYSPEAALQNAETILVADASPSAPKFNASELVILLKILNSRDKDVMISFYPGESISASIAKTAYRLSLTPNGSNTLTLNEETTDIFTKLFYSPTERVQNMKERGEQKGTSEQETQAKILKYMQFLPATLFQSSRAEYPTQVLEEMQANLALISELLEVPMNSNLNILDARQLLAEMTLKELGEKYEAINRDALSWTCPECSTGKGEAVKHIVTYAGKWIVNQGSFANYQHQVEPKCKPVRNFIEKGLKIEEIPLGQLIQAGFRLRGLAMYEAEAILLTGGGNALAIRDYSNPRGTLWSNATWWNENIAVTPRIKVITEGRDATMYELVEFMLASSQNAQTLQVLFKELPAISDGRNYVLDLDRATFEITWE
jgi:hypothetical protein